MNSITKKSFFSFLTLYLLSSFIFLIMASYWFFASQKAIEMQNNYYKMNHISDKVSSAIIKAHMMKTKFQLKLVKDASIGLYDKKQKLIAGNNLEKIDFSQEYYQNGKTFTLVSKRPARHLGIDYVVVQSKQCAQNVMQLKNRVIVISIFVGIAIIIIAVILSYMFLQPIKDKMQDIEDFVKDTAHELNTPITALMMSTSRAKNKKIYDEKIIKNISISTKQLYDIYSSLSFLNFDTKSEEAIELNLADEVNQSIEYFNELLEKKHIAISCESQTCKLLIAPTKAKMLVNNLLSNAIKYSFPNTKIHIRINKDEFIIKDEGIGIARDKLHIIFKRFTRANSYAGGFGVGLSIVKSITQDYNYTIDISSEENIGTTVHIKFNTKEDYAI